jgi:hypothetical protein
MTSLSTVTRSLAKNVSLDPARNSRYGMAKLSTTLIGRIASIVTLSDDA